MPPASSYRPLLPAIKARPADDSDPPGASGEPADPTSSTKRKREMVAVACTVCRSRKIACDGKRPLCTPCARRRRPSPSQCVYNDKQETISSLRRRMQELQEEVKEHENTMDLLTSLPDGEAIRLLHRFKSMRRQGRKPPPPPPPPSSRPAGGAGRNDDDDDDKDDDDDGDDYDPTSILCPDDATMLPTDVSPLDLPWPGGGGGGFAYPRPTPMPGEYMYPYGAVPALQQPSPEFASMGDMNVFGLSTSPSMGPATPPAECETRWRNMNIK